MRLQSEIKQYFIDTFTNFGGIKMVIVGGVDKVNASMLNNIEYPAVWIMYPFSRRKILRGDYPAAQWKFEALVLLHAKPDDDEKIEQNFDVALEIGEAFLEKLYKDSQTSHGELFTFDTEGDVDDWQPKEHFSGDNCNGWLIPFKFTTNI
jgi:hypothetical protein